MLNHQPWITLGCDVMLEYEQCVMEGRDVAKFEPLCREVQKICAENPLKGETLAIELVERMHAVPVSESFGFEEPSELDAIFAAAPADKPVLPAVPEEETLKRKVAGAWYGRIAGCLIGKPVEGWRTNALYPLLKGTDNYPMHKYIMKSDFSEELIKELRINVHNCWADNVHGISPIDDDTNYTVFGMKLVDVYGKNFKPMDVLEAWMAWIPMLATCTAERVAYRNGAMGMLPPETAVYKNPYREWIGAQIRGDFFGYVNPGNPETAADMAFRDASISHVKNGIYGEMFVSAMLAAAATTTDVRTVINVGLSYIPEKSRLTRDVKKILALYDDGLSAEDIIVEIQKDYNEYSQVGWCYTNSNAMIVTMALLCGNLDFGKSVCLAVQPGFDTDCNGATVGSIVGMMIGEDGISDYWKAPFAGRLRTSIDGYNTVDVEMLTKKTLDLIRRDR